MSSSTNNRPQSRSPPPYQLHQHPRHIDTTVPIDLIAARSNGQIFTPIQALEAMVLKYGSGERSVDFLKGWNTELRMGTMVEVSPGLFRFVKEHPENRMFASGNLEEVAPGLFLWDPARRYM